MNKFTFEIGLFERFNDVKLVKSERLSGRNWIFKFDKFNYIII